MRRQRTVWPRANREIVAEQLTCEWWSGGVDTWTVAIWTIKPGREDEFAAEWQVFFDWTVREVPGVIGGARIFRGMDRPDRFFSPMHWHSAEAVAAWQNRPATRAWRERVRPLVEDEELHTMVTALEIKPA